MATVELAIDHVTDAALVGRGGFSSVYSARHSLLQRPVAVKVLNDLSDDDDRGSFERECAVMGRLAEHPNVIAVYHAGFSKDEKPFIIMELVTGGTLADRLKRGPVTWREAIGYLLPICEALGAAHAAGILHRDVKPENVLLDGENPKLADFGIARLRNVIGATSTHITASWLHTAPETFDNNRDERSDLYSLASTMYELVTGYAPFWRADDESLGPLMLRLVSEPAPPLPAGLAPVAVGDFLASALAKNPADRPQTAAVMADQLRCLIGMGSAPAQADPKRSTPKRKSAVAAPVAVPGKRAPAPKGPWPRPPTPAYAIRPTQVPPRAAPQSVWSPDAPRSRLWPVPSAPGPQPSTQMPSTRWGALLFMIVTLAIMAVAVAAVMRGPAADSGTEPPSRFVLPTTNPDRVSPSCEGALLYEQGRYPTGETVGISLTPRLCYRWTIEGKAGQLIIGRGFANNGEDIQLALENSVGEVVLSQDENLTGQFQERFGSGLRFDSNSQYRIVLLVREGDGGRGGVFFDVQE